MDYPLVLLLCVYLAPWIVAEARARDDGTRILVFNLLLGWTVVGWVAAWVWALSRHEPPERPELRVITNSQPRQPRVQQGSAEAPPAREARDR
jgi:cytoskeletal protein RodZ